MTRTATEYPQRIRRDPERDRAVRVLASIGLLTAGVVLICGWLVALVHVNLPAITVGSFLVVTAFCTLVASVEKALMYGTRSQWNGVAVIGGCSVFVVLWCVL
jgi:cation transport ATPase